MKLLQLLAAAGGAVLLGAIPSAAGAAQQASQGKQTIVARELGHAIDLDGDLRDWADVAGMRVALTGTGGAEEVEIRAAIHGDRIYMLAVWSDTTADTLHKPHRWNETTFSYEKADEHEDRFALSLPIEGEFSANKIGGNAFIADVWHWKAHRSNPIGLAHDKIWQVSRTPFEGSRAFPDGSGGTVHLQRRSDAGDRLYKPVRYVLKDQELMPGYKLNEGAAGSVADVSAHGRWVDGKWVLELSRALNTGHEDDAVIPREGEIDLAFAVFDGVSHNMVDGGEHSTSEIVRLRTVPARGS